MSPLNLEKFESHGNRVVAEKGNDAAEGGFNHEEYVNLTRAALEYQEYLRQLERERIEAMRAEADRRARERAEAENVERRQLLFRGLAFARFLRSQGSEGAANIHMASLFEMDPQLFEMYQMLLRRRELNGRNSQ